MAAPVVILGLRDTQTYAVTALNATPSLTEIFTVLVPVESARFVAYFQDAIAPPAIPSRRDGYVARGGLPAWGNFITQAEYISASAVFEDRRYLNPGWDEAPKGACKPKGKEKQEYIKYSFCGGATDCVITLASFA